VNTILDYYTQYNEENRLTKDQSHKIEFITCTNALDKIISQKSKILELGAGSAEYSFYYAKNGHDVTATDLVQKNLDGIENRLGLHPEIKLNCKRVDARDLSDFQNSSFDAVLNLGPLYHLIEKSDQKKCFSESLRVLKPEGILAVAYINKYFYIPYCLKNDRADILEDNFVNKVIDKGYIEAKDEFWTDVNFFSPKEIEELLLHYGVEIIDHVATDTISPMIADSINSLNEHQYSKWVNYHLKTCREPSILGLSNHSLIICRKINKNV